MASYSWSVNKSGSWGLASNWGTATPTAADDVSIGVAGITVTVGAGVTAAANTLNLVNSTLAVTGGTLFTVRLATFNGAYVQSGGTYSMSGFGANFYNNFTQTGGTIKVLSGAIQLNNGGSLAGTLAGTGALGIVNGSAYVNTGFACSLNSIVIGAQGGKLGFNINFTYAKNLTLLNNGVLDLFGHTLTLSGTSLLEGVVGFGKIIDSGSMTLGSQSGIAVLDNGLTLNVTGSLAQNGNILLGASDAGAKVIIAKTGTYTINGNYYIGNPSSVGSITNAGVFAKAFGGKTARIDTNFTSTGVIKTQIGTLLINGLVNTISGIVSGNGTLGIAGGQTTFGAKIALNQAALSQQSGILVINKPLTYGGEWDLTGGVLNLNTSAATLTLSNQANFDGGTLTSFGGTLLLNGATHAGNVTLGGPTAIDINGVLDQSATITLGLSSNPTANIAVGASWIIEGDSSIIGAFGNINNLGNFTDPNGSGNSIVQSQFFNGATGTITANNSTLTLAGGNVLTGTITGNGQLDLAGSTVLEAGLVTNVANLTVNNSNVALAADVAYANNFAQVGGVATLDLGGNTLTLTGRATLDAGLLTGGGVLLANGPTLVGNYNIGGTADLTIAGTAEQTGRLNLSPGTGPGTLSIAAAGSYTLDDDLSILGAGAIANAGIFAAAGTGLSQIGANFSQTGTLLVNNQLLQFGGGGSLAGTIAGAGTLQFTSYSGIATYQLKSGLSFGGANWQVAQNADVQVLADTNYAGLFQQFASSVLDVTGHTLTLSGTASSAGGILTGPGTLLSSGNGTFANMLLTGGAVLAITGTSEQNATIQLGDGTTTGTLLVGAGGSYTLDENNAIVGNGIVSVASGGTLIAAANGFSQITTAIVDAGTIAANLGTLSIANTVSGAGAFSIGATGLLEVANNGKITASNTVSFSAAGGHLQIDNPPNFNAIIAQFSTGDIIDLPGFDQNTISGSFTAGNTKLLVTDARGDSLTLTFSAAQTPSAFHFGAVDAAHPTYAAIFHS